MIVAADTAAELRIIAKDAPISGADRDVIVRAADELEIASRQIAAAHLEMAEMTQREGALKDRVRSLQSRWGWSMSTGWMKAVRNS